MYIKMAKKPNSCDESTLSVWQKIATFAAVNTKFNKKKSNVTFELTIIIRSLLDVHAQSGQHS